MMKRITLLLIISLSFGALSYGQRANDQRTNSTKIADFLRQLPAENFEKLEEAMQEVAGLDESGIIDLIKMFSPAEKNENAKLEYAVSGFTGYVSVPSRESLRSKTATAYGKALNANTDSEVRAFVLSQLQWIGHDESIGYITPFLTDIRLVDPASRALVGIGTPAAETALTEALNAATDETAPSLLEAVGDLQIEEALSAVSNYAQHENERIRKTALYALAAIANEQSASLLSRAAANSHYSFDNTLAFGAYSNYIRNLNLKGNQRLAEKLAKDLIKQTAKQETQARIAALELLVDIQGERSLSTLAKAASDKDKVYRVAALKLGEPFMNASQSSFWLKQLRKSNPDSRAELITIIGDKNMPLLLPLIRTQLKSSSPQVKLAAIRAASKIGGSSVVADLLPILREGNIKEVAAARDALLTIEGNDITSTLARELDQTPKVSQAAILSILGQRGAMDESKRIFSYVNDADSNVKQAAFQALTTTVAEKDLPQLFDMLNATANARQAEQLQTAVSFALREIQGEDNKTDRVLAAMNNAPTQQKYHYYGILSNIGSDKALHAVSQAYNSSNQINRNAAFQALSGWKQEEALPIIYKITTEVTNPEELNQALTGFVRLVNTSSKTSDQKVLMLKDAMALSKTVAQQRLVLRALSEHKTFPALAFAGKFLENKDLAQQAANTVMEIALANPDLTGEIVKDYLQTTIAELRGQDSDYLREAIRKHLSEMNDEKGFVQVFNGKDLSGWKGLVENPIARQKMSAKTLAQKQEEADRIMHEGWKVVNGELLFLGKGDNIVTEKEYGDIEMWVDWKIYDDGHKEGDAGIYLRGTPQVQIWDTSRVKVGAQVGSGGLYNNQVHESKPLKVADNPLGEWNTFFIRMVDDKVTVYLNGELVTDNVVLENFWDRNAPIFAKEQIELQAHGSRIGYRDIYIKELESTKPYELTNEEKKEGFEILFDGTSMDKWTGNTKDYQIENNQMVIRPSEGSGGNLFTKDEFSDFVFRFEFKLTSGANNGLGVRAPLEGDIAYEGIEIQILDDNADIYKNLKEWQYHGSLYGIMTAKRGHLKPLGEWNYQEVEVKGDHFKVTLNGTVIIDGSIADAKKNGTLDGLDHPGLFRTSGRIAFLGHGSEVHFKNIRVKRL